jgi:hypothetical protein
MRAQIGRTRTWRAGIRARRIPKMPAARGATGPGWAPRAAQPNTRNTQGTLAVTRPTSSPRRAATATPAAPATPPTRAAAGGRRIQVRRSGVHGKGVFAVQPIAAGDTVIEYVGEVITWEEAQRRHPHDPCDPNHTFYFHIDGDHVIDALFEGNASKWINHACDPNCESDERGGRIFIQAVRDIAAGEELNYDYGLVLDERYTPKLKAEYACHCGSPLCRGTMLAPKRGVKLAARPAQPEVKAKAKTVKVKAGEAKVNAKAQAAKPAKSAKAKTSPQVKTANGARADQAVKKPQATEPAPTEPARSAKAKAKTGQSVQPASKAKSATRAKA